MLYHPWRGMTPRVLSIILWSAAAPVVLSSSRVDNSLKCEMIQLQDCLYLKT